jgi:isoleucyl-tRNA synthetase
MAEFTRAFETADPVQVYARWRTGQSIEVAGFTLEPDDLVVTSADVEGYQVAYEGGYLVALSTEITPELAREGLARELVHRLQTMRKNAGFDIADYIETYYQARGPLLEAIEGFADYIKQETLSRQLTPGPPPPGAYQESQRLEGEEVTLAVKRV